MRTEQQIFDDLAAVCTTPGYAHAIALFCFRDNVIGYHTELHAKDYSTLFSAERLIRTEISTLIGLMARAPIDLSLPSQKQLQTLIERTETLLKELHDAMMRPFVTGLQSALAESSVDPFNTAEAMREPIFYGAESAYSFQYRDLSVKKYARDGKWLKQNTGFSMQDASQTVAAISQFLNENLLATLRTLAPAPADDWSILRGFEFSPSDIAAKSGFPLATVNNVLTAFSSANDHNSAFTSLHEFNSTNAYPLLKVSEAQYVLFQYFSLTEALYETPYYWMAADASYGPTAMANRGTFAEDFTAERLAHVFGASNVFQNVSIFASKGRQVGEIDTLVLFGDRAIVVQAKSKKLTLAARKGNDHQLKSDFKSAVQDACDQAYACSQQLLSASSTFIDGTGKELKIPQPIKLVHPLCLVSDHYPALSFQARQFLRYTKTDAIQTPLVCDVFFLDAVTEMLDTPLRCLSYLELRATAGDKIMLSHELTALGFHLKQNLWLGEYDSVFLGDDISADLDVAMAVRREGIKGRRTPPGILTEFRGSSIGRIIDEIERGADAGAIGLGLQLLKLSGNTVRDLSRAIDTIASQSTKDGEQHDITVGIDGAGSGITIHCNNLPDRLAAHYLRRHCELRKYSQQAQTWFGIAIQPGNAELRFGLMLDYPWKTDEELAKAVERAPKLLPGNSLHKFAKSGRVSPRRSRKTGRNDLCPCGSGLKYKRCCLIKTRS